MEEKAADASLTRTDPIYHSEVDVSGVNEKHLLRKIDLHVIPWLAFLYLLSFLDRGSIGNAKVCQYYD